MALWRLAFSWRAKLLSNRARLFRSLVEALLVRQRETWPAIALTPASWARGGSDRSQWQHVLIRQDSYMGSFDSGICVAKVAAVEGNRVDL